MNILLITSSFSHASHSTSLAHLAAKAIEGTYRSLNPDQS